MRKLVLAAVLALMAGVVIVGQVGALEITNGSFQNGLTAWTDFSVDHVSWGDGGAVDLNAFAPGYITQIITLTSGDSGDYIWSWDESANWSNSADSKSYEAYWALTSGDGSLLAEATTGLLHTGPKRAGWNHLTNDPSDLKYVSRSVVIHIPAEYLAPPTVLPTTLLLHLKSYQALTSEGALIDNVQLVPEPSTALLLGIGLVGMAARRRPAG